MQSEEGGVHVFPHSFNLGAITWWMVNATPRPLSYPEKSRYRFCRRLVVPQKHSGRVQKISPTPGFQPEASRYTYYVTLIAITFRMLV